MLTADTHGSLAFAEAPPHDTLLSHSLSSAAMPALLGMLRAADLRGLQQLGRRWRRWLRRHRGGGQRVRAPVEATSYASLRATWKNSGGIRQAHACYYFLRKDCSIEGRVTGTAKIAQPQIRGWSFLCTCELEQYLPAPSRSP